MASNYKSVEKNAFLGQTTITAVSFGEKCKTVEESAFADCSELSDINVDNEIITICSKAFTHTSIINVTFNSVETIGNSAFEGCKCLKYITINNGCSFIGDYAFRDCETLTSVDIPNNENFKTISNGTFENCCSIKEISIPKYITTIGSSAFNGCGKLSSVIFDPGSQVENIGNFAFNNCSSIKAISIPNTTTNIGYGAFRECKSLTSAIIGNSVTTIQGEAFNGCIGLTNINIPNSVTTIEKEAFARCSGLTTISIGSGITTIGGGAFLNCNKLKNVYTNDIASWCNIDFTDKESNPLHVGGNLCLNNDPNTKLNITLPSDGVKKYAFYNCKNISNITIPNEFTSDKFGKEAFHGVVNHRVINLSNDITVTSNHGENGCVGKGAQEIINAYNGEIHDEIFVFGQKSQNINSDWALFKYLGTEEIYNSKYEDSGLILPDKDYTYEINEGVFKDHTEIKNITIPTDVTSIGNYTFNGCSGLTTLTIEGYDYGNSESEIDDTKPVVYKMEMDGSESEIEPVLILGYNEESSNERKDGKGLFKNCPLKSLYLGRNISYETTKKYGYSPFSGISSLKTVNIGDDVTNINENMFYNCREINSVNIGNSVKNIGSSAFHYCSKLTSVTIPNSVTSIGELAFSNCSLTDGVYIKSLAAWCNIDFKYQPDSDDYKYDSNPLCKSGGKLYLNGNLVEGDIVIPKGVKNIGFCTFYGCNIESVTIPDSVRSIGESAFNWCSNLTSVTLGNNVNSIGSDAFANCGNIKIYINGSTIPGSWCKINFANKGANPASISGGLYNNENIDDEEKNKPIENIIIPNDVKNIGSYAFYNFKDTKSIIIPNSVTSIGEGAFAGCGTHIKRIVIGNDINTIGFKAFGDIGDVDIIIIGKNAPLIDDNIYDAVNQHNEPILINFSINDYDEYNRFGDLYPHNIRNYPDAKSYDGDFMFDSKNDSHILCGYMGVGELVLPTNYNENEYKIGDFTFYNCDMLKNITIPKSVTEIGDRAFCGCSGLESIVVKNGNSVYDSPDDCNAIITKAGNTLIQGCKNTIIPNGVKKIGNYAFYNCDTLTRIEIPSSVEEIEEFAFWGCTNLRTVINSSKLKITLQSTNNGYVGRYAEEIINNSSEELDIYENFAFKKDGKILIKYVGDRTAEEINFPKTYIGSNYVIGDEENEVFDYDSRNIIKRITIPNSVTSIGNSAFRNCSGLTSVTIPNGVTSIGKEAFKGCDNLKTVINLSSNSDLKIENNDKNGYVGNYADNIINYTDAYIEGDFGWVENEGANILVAYIGNDKELTLPMDYKEYVIGEFVFENYTSLNKVTIPNAVTSIGDYAFYGCTNLKTVINYSSSFTIKNNESNGCVGKYAETITNITNDSYKDFVFKTTDDGVNILIGYKGDSIPEELKLPETYNGKNYVIGDEAFMYCYDITNITIPNSVTSIGDYAFYDCSNLTNITIGNSVTSIGGEAFNETAWYNNQPDGVVYAGKVLYKYKGEMPENTSININDGYLGIADNAFYDCDGLTSIEIPNSVTHIGNGAFNNCDNLVSVIIGNGVTSIGEDVFKDCGNLKTVINLSELNINDYVANDVNVIKLNSAATNISIDGDFVWAKINGNNTLCSYIGEDSKLDLPANYKGEKYVIGEKMFYGSDNLTSITIPNSVTSIGDYAFYGCAHINENDNSISGLTSVTFDDKSILETIGNNAFEGCSKLTSITIPNSVTSIGERAFKDCTYSEEFSLKSVTIGNSVTSIGGYAFSGCDYIKEINIPSGVTKIENGVFFNCGRLANITIPDNITSIGNYAFYNCSKLTSITIPNSVISIGEHTFEGCSSIKSVTIPNNVTSIENYMFYNCSDLESITIPERVTRIGDYVFSGCSDLASVTIPERVTSIGERAFAGTSIVNINIPENVVSIKDGTFSSCKKLKTITLHSNSFVSIGKDVFPSRLVDNKITIYVPTNMKSAYINDDNWKKYNSIIVFDIIKQ